MFEATTELTKLAGHEGESLKRKNKKGNMER